MTLDNFISEKWSKQLQIRLKKELVWRQVMNTDYQGEIQKVGDTVRVNALGPVTINTYTKNTWNMTPQVLTGAGQAMQITQADDFDFAIDDVDDAQINGDVMAKAMDEAAYGLRDTIDQFCASKHAAALGSANILNWGGTVSSTSNPIPVGPGLGYASIYELMVDMATLMNLAKVPAGGRWIVFEPRGVGNILKDVRFSGFATAQAAATIAKGSTSGGELGGTLGGMLEQITGIKPYVSVNTPVSGSGSTAIYTVMAGYTGCGSFAMQIPPGSPETMRYTGGFADRVRGLQLYGAHIFRPEALVAAYVQYPLG